CMWAGSSGGCCGVVTGSLSSGAASPLIFLTGSSGWGLSQCHSHLERVRLQYARWDLSGVGLIDPHTLNTLCQLYPLDKSANADGKRRTLAPAESDQYPKTRSAPKELPPLLRKLLADYAATGLPPAYLPKHDDKEPTE
ncbi:MAG: hypothetical protein KBT64_14900, partial [Sulfitobacter litoralis]|nr:hypothetical protein [Sulfitobacter litoralis]